jgi:RNA polymerase sigma factor (sigma-70 family)
MRRWPVSYKLSDDVILNGFRASNEEITKHFFYGYCRMAYDIFDRKYGLSHKVGLDFYSLAHDYYIHLLKNNWKELEDKSPRVKLSTWMISGFRFVILDAMKAYNREFNDRIVDNEDKERRMNAVPNPTRNFKMEEAINSICDTRYAHDNISKMILRKIVIEGYKEKEIAKILGITPAAVTYRYKKIKQEIVPDLIEYSYDGR